MRIVVTGAGGFVGTRLVSALLEIGHVGQTRITEVTASDVETPHFADDPRLRLLAGDIAEPHFVERLIAPDTGAVVHLAAVVSGSAERDLDLGMRVNVDGIRAMLETCRALGTRPLFVFASSVAVYGGALPAVVSEKTATTPQTSYGTQKAIAELLISDYTRRGLVDGRVLRLPTITVRGGAPNTAVTSFASTIIRDPLSGREAVCPVSGDTEVWVLSPQRLIECLVHALGLPAESWGPSRVVALPGVLTTAEGMVAALRDIAGEAVAARVRWERDSFLDEVVSGLPTRFDTTRADALGFVGDADVAEIIRAFIDDDLEGAFVS